jgi:hypothetical protein
MAAKRKRRVEATQSKNVLEKLSPEEALVVLQELTGSSLSIRKKAEEIALRLIAGVDLDEIAEDVFWALDSIAVEDVWDDSGRKRHGYVDPGDCAWQLFDDALEPFMRQLQKCQELSLHEQAKLYCLGILKGIHQFDTESTSEYKSWAVDAPGEFFSSVYERWKRGAKRKRDVVEAQKFVASLGARWARLCK